MASQRWIRLPWVLGTSIIVVSLIGAGQVLQNARTVEAGPHDAPAVIRDSVGTGVICLGRVDVEPGLIRLFPNQPGSVTDVFCTEGQQVKKGDALLKVLDAPFRYKFDEAVEGVKAAESQLKQAKQLVDKYPEVIAQQEAAVRRAKALQGVAQAQIERGEKLVKANIPQMSGDELRALQESGRAAAEHVAAEEARLREIKVTDPKDKVTEAQTNVELQRKKVDQAREAVERCTVTAPMDSTVLRVQAVVGAQFNTQSHDPALILAPIGPRIVRLEVDQEFAGRIGMGATVQLQDESNVGPIWNGKIIRIAEAYLPKRPAPSGPEVLTSNSESRPLEVIVSVDPSSNSMPRVGQRMRGSIGSAASPPAVASHPAS